MTSTRLDIREYTAVISLLIVLIMTVLDVTLVNVALPVLAVEFSVSDSTAVWINTIYQLVITMLLLPFASAGDLYSYKKTFLSGIFIFTLASLACALSNSFLLLIISRAIQGIGAACIMGVNIALTRIIYPKEVIGRGLALNAMVIAIATAAGPSLAGSILTFASWHTLFLINIPFGIIAFIIGFKLLPENPPKNRQKQFDFVGAIQNVAVFCIIFLALNIFSKKNNIYIGIILLITGLILGFFYIRRQSNKENPLFPVDLFKIKLYTVSIFTSLCSFIAQNLVLVSLPFILLSNMGFSEITTGLLMTPWPIATMIISPIAARIAEKGNPGIIAAIGMGIFATGVFLILSIGDTAPSYSDIIWRMAVCGIGYGLYQTPNNIVMVMATPVCRSGGAGGAQSTTRLFGQTLGSTLVTIIFALASGINSGTKICLFSAIIFAAIAGSFSFSRATGIARLK